VALAPSRMWGKWRSTSVTRKNFWFNVGNVLKCSEDFL
jgi:hypothetical protein